MSEVSLKLDLLALSAGLYTKCTVHHVSCWFIHQVLVLIFPLIPATYLQCLLYMLAFRPAVQATQCYHGEHFDPVSTSGICLPPPLILHSFCTLHPSLFSLHWNPASILEGNDCSFSFSFSQIHSPTVFGTSSLLSSYSNSYSIESF
ncbi:hypothetical protein ATANTOWER_007087 [Ataeniobius toweri]|uniref:Uncharacterized protein n=1 Tax=Ataeniobius toweri TaxID=208326 RepID=A0ABU7AP78_9TELE|nr:hypothetical protein [Ataeniobius toweri]